MPRRKRPAYGTEACGMVEDCGGTPAFVVALPTCRSTRKTPAPSANVSDGGVIARTCCEGQTNKGRPGRMNKVDLVCVRAADCGAPASVNLV